MSYGQPLREGDRIWVTCEDGGCISGAWTLRREEDGTWYFRFRDNWASDQPIRYLIRYADEYLLGIWDQQTLNLVQERDNIDCMAEQAFAEGLLPMEWD